MVYSNRHHFYSIRYDTRETVSNGQKNPQNSICPILSLLYSCFCSAISTHSRTLKTKKSSPRFLSFSRPLCVHIAGLCVRWPSTFLVLCMWHYVLVRFVSLCAHWGFGVYNSLRAISSISLQCFLNGYSLKDNNLQKRSTQHIYFFNLNKVENFFEFRLSLVCLFVFFFCLSYFFLFSAFITKVCCMWPMSLR